jgi:hypothetical protein
VRGLLFLFLSSTPRPSFLILLPQHVVWPLAPATGSCFCVYTGPICCALFRFARGSRCSFPVGVPGCFICVARGGLFQSALVGNTLPWQFRWLIPLSCPSAHDLVLLPPPVLAAESAQFLLIRLAAYLCWIFISRTLFSIMCELLQGEACCVLEVPDQKV